MNYNILSQSYIPPCIYMVRELISINYNLLSQSYIPPCMVRASQQPHLLYFSFYSSLGRKTSPKKLSNTLPNKGVTLTPYIWESCIHSLKLLKLKKKYFLSPLLFSSSLIYCYITFYKSKNIGKVLKKYF